MKIVGKSDATLYEGDRIKCSVSHQVKIGREESWIGFEVFTAVQPDETVEHATQRAIEVTDEGVMKAITAVVATVQKVSG